MRLLLSLLFAVVLLVVGCGSEKQEAAKTEKPALEEKKEMAMDASKPYYYTCPMEEHKHIHADAEGKCPECNMDLVPAVAATGDAVEYYGCAMPEHSHVRMDKPGKCPECNMDLQGMKLQKTM